MVIFLTLSFSLFVALYFGIIKLMDSKKEELLQFIVMYMFMVLLMGSLSYIIGSKNASLHYFSIHEQLGVAAYYIPPTFLISYLLYPFKIIKRDRIIIWILLGYTLIVVGGSGLLNILVTFSKM